MDHTASQHRYIQPGPEQPVTGDTPGSEPHAAANLDAALADGGYRPLGSRQGGPRTTGQPPRERADDGWPPLFDRSARWTVAVVVVALLAALLVVAVPLHRQLGF